MDNRFEHYWHRSLHRSKLRYALIASVVFHGVLIAVLFGYFNWWPEPEAPKVFRVQLVPTSEKVSDTPTEKVVEAPAPEPTPPEPEPVVEPPTPEPPPPPPKPVVKPDPPKEDQAKRVLEEKARKKKEKEEREKKAKLEKEKKEREQKKKLEQEKAKKKAREEKKKKEEEEERKKREKEKKMELERLAKLKAEAAQGVVADELPTGLSGWARMVQRKVEHEWTIPAGIRLSEDDETVRVGFWVNSAGEIFDGPSILEGTTQPALDASCISALKAASPFPPFPDGVDEPEQYIVYVFKTLR
jgi:TonB family protein